MRKKWFIVSITKFCFISYTLMATNDEKRADDEKTKISLIV